MRNLLFAALTWQSLPINYSQNRAFGHFYGGGSKLLVESGDGRISHGIKNILTFYRVTCISR